MTTLASDSCTHSSVAKVRLSDAGGPRFESQAGWVTGKSTPSPWRDKHPAIKGLRPPEQHAGQLHPDHKKTLSQNNNWLPYGERQENNDFLAASSKERPQTAIANITAPQLCIN